MLEYLSTFYRWIIGRKKFSTLRLDHSGVRLASIHFSTSIECRDFTFELNIDEDQLNFCLNFIDLLQPRENTVRIEVEIHRNKEIGLDRSYTFSLVCDSSDKLWKFKQIFYDDKEMPDTHGGTTRIVSTCKEYMTIKVSRNNNIGKPKKKRQRCQ